ncbi:MAG TPA: hypothetical protein ENN05_03185 [Deltaproteobacteria bacterium]|nr:hypothetical protein [Deltaproteobacteria bacterium]
MLLRFASVPLESNQSRRDLVIGRYTCFVLKGETAINLFIRYRPLISDDIDLACLPLKPRNEALAEIRDALL